jgi:hypothetical protein
MYIKNRELTNAIRSWEDATNMDEKQQHRALVKKLEITVAELEDSAARMDKEYLGIVRTHLGMDITAKELCRMLQTTEPDEKTLSAETNAEQDFDLDSMDIDCEEENGLNRSSLM